ncbi:NADH dehydrogenase [ubiquinone] 1 beta subcomplex subunit 3-like [Littorina saxatilis]|uniref:NADH dehydrogenase [ubiquinone] 1 beta subcomplex subunit 3 n=1 Tax=Littorina saxatilis TaxID=31220 RepID=A0AAN9BTH8_9CAEN
MGGGEKFQVPDWRSYKVDGIKELEKLQQMLAARGLKDPWIRNDVWRYTKENYGGQWRNAAISLGRGLKWAVAAMAVTIAVDKFISKEADHGQGDHGDH